MPYLIDASQISKRKSARPRGTWFKSRQPTKHKQPPMALLPSSAVGNRFFGSRWPRAGVGETRCCILIVKFPFPDWISSAILTTKAGEGYICDCDRGRNSAANHQNLRSPSQYIQTLQSPSSTKHACLVFKELCKDINNFTKIFPPFPESKVTTSDNHWPQHQAFMHKGRRSEFIVVSCYTRSLEVNRFIR